VGAVGAILPPLVGAAEPAATAEQPDQRSASAPELAERVRQLLSAWASEQAGQTNSGAAASVTPPGPLVGAVRSPQAGFLAACMDGATPVLVAWECADASCAAGGADATTDLRVVARVAAAAGGPSVPVDGAARDRALALLARWRSARQAADVVGLRDAASGQVRRRVIERIAHIVRRAPQHRRPAVVTLARAARRAALLPCGAGAERVLGELAAAEMPDDAWLRAVGAFGEGQPRNATTTAHHHASDPSSVRSSAVLRAMLLIQADG